MSTPTYPVFSTPFTAESQQGGFVPSFPFGERRPDALVINARFWQRRANYVRPASNVRNCSAYPTAIFCDDTGFKNIPGDFGVVEWTRTWATIPGQVIDFESFAYTFPGYAASLLSPVGRVPVSKTVTSKLVMDFFLTGPGGSYGDPAAIPAFAGQEYTYGPLSGEIAAEYLSTSSSPTLADYKALVATDAGDPASYSLEAHDSILDIHMGNIWRRTRRRIKAR